MHTGEAIERDRYGRPLIIDLESGKKIPYTRASTMAKTHDDQYRILQSKTNKVMKQLISSPEYFSRIANTEEYFVLETISDELYRQAGGMERAGMGTALHTLTEFIDRGENVPVEAVGGFGPDLLAYRQTVDANGLTAARMEEFVIIDEIQTAGSFDRIWNSVELGLVVGDLKTGKTAPRYAATTELQVAMYAHGKLYDPVTGQRSPLPDELRTDLGLLIHLPALEGKCDLYTLDLERGWEQAKRAYETKLWRKTKANVPYSLV